MQTAATTAPATLTSSELLEAVEGLLGAAHALEAEGDLRGSVQQEEAALNLRARNELLIRRALQTRQREGDGAADSGLGGESAGRQYVSNSNNAQGAPSLPSPSSHRRHRRVTATALSGDDEPAGHDYGAAGAEGTEGAAAERPEVPPTLWEAAKAAVLRCNDLAVARFGTKDFRTAEYLLERAMALTSSADVNGSGSIKASSKGGGRTNGRASFVAADSGSAAAVSAAGGGRSAAAGDEDAEAYFAGAEGERLRLRSTTHNNYGCLERRRGRPAEALSHLREAVAYERRADPSSDGGSPATFLNLCTVLNDLGRHEEAVTAAERAAATLAQQLQQQRTTGGGNKNGKSAAEEKERTAMLLAVVLYNLGVSQERAAAQAGGDGERKEAARAAYTQSLSVIKAHRLNTECPTAVAARQALQRLASPLRRSSALLVLPPAKSRPSTAIAEGPPKEPSAEPSALDQQPPIAASYNGGSSNSNNNNVPRGVSATLPALPTSSASPQQQQQQQRAPELDWGGAGDAAPQVRPTPAWSSVSDGGNHGANGRSPSLPFTPSSEFMFARATAPGGPSRRRGSSNARMSLNTNYAGKGAGRANGGAGTNKSNGARALGPPPLSPMLRESGGDDVTRTVPEAAPSLPLALRAGSANVASTAGGRGLPGGLRRQLAVPGRRTESASAAPPAQHSLDSSGTHLTGSVSAGNASRVLPPLTGASSPNSAAAGNGSRLVTVLGGPALPGGASQGDGDDPVGSADRYRRTSRGSVVSEAATAAPGATAAELLKTRLRREKARRRAGPGGPQQDGASSERIAQTVDEVHARMVREMREAEERPREAAAVSIQRVWRGVATRERVRAMIGAALVLQRAVRRLLGRRDLERRRERAEREQQEAAEAARRTRAANVLNHYARLWLRRRQVAREHKAAAMRDYYSARTIQRGYRAARQRRADRRAAMARALREEHERRVAAEDAAARRIQGVARTYLDRKAAERAAAQRARESEAATKIQAQVRGRNTRAWFVYYKEQRRQERLQSAEVQAAATLVQSFCRQRLAREAAVEATARGLRGALADRHNAAATTIQSLWRRRVAQIHYERLKADKERRDRHATSIQRWYATRVARRAFLELYEAKTRDRAARRVQRWWRGCQQAQKERDFAAYHAELLRQQHLEQLREASAVTVQAFLRARQSDLVTGTMRQAYERNTTVALALQRVGRGYAARVDMAGEQAAAYRVRQSEARHARETAAAEVIQRAWRCASAKATVEQMRREAHAATIITRNARVFRARAELRRLRAERDAATRDRAARRIQAAARQYIRRARAKDAEAYYAARRRKKMENLRREEAVVMIQAQWRGYVTRREVGRQRDALRALDPYAAKIQRAWRNRSGRTALQAEMEQRRDERRTREAAAVAIQSQWRMAAAKERVRAVRAHNALRERSAVRIQCWWRQQLAARELRRRRAEREEEEAVALLYAQLWEETVTAVNACLRARQSELLVRQRLHDSLLRQLSRTERARFLQRNSAATRIQANYRGYRDRVRAAEMRAARAEAARQQAEREARERAAAVRIQCWWRQQSARRELERRRAEKREAVLRTHAEYLETADPGDLVRELFWLHGATQKRRDATQRLTQLERQERAARMIQRAYRARRARRAAADIAATLRAQKAARTIAEHWRRHQSRVAARGDRERAEAAVRIQKLVRGWIVRRRFKAFKRAADEDKYMQITIEDVLDHAATAIQTAWRRYAAVLRVAAMLARRAAEKEAQRRHEAASTIQGAYRTYRRRRALRQLKQENQQDYDDLGFGDEY